MTGDLNQNKKSQIRITQQEEDKIIKQMVEVATLESDEELKKESFEQINERKMLQIKSNDDQGHSRVSKSPHAQNRRRTRSQIKLAFSNKKDKDEKLDMNADYDDEDEDQYSATQKKRLEGGKEEIVKKNKKEKQPQSSIKPKEFKKGEENPQIELVLVEKYKDYKSSKPYFDCCIRCNNKNLFRAVNTRDQKLLDDCIYLTKRISILNPYWSPDNRVTPIQLIIGNNLLNMIEKVLPCQYTQSNQQQLNSNRINNPQYLLNLLDSGMMSNMAYGTRENKVQMKRGNRQENNAFLEYMDNSATSPWSHIEDASFLKKMNYNMHMNLDTLHKLIKLNPRLKLILSTQVFQAVRAGNQEIAYEILQNFSKCPGYGFNNLHAKVLNPKQVALTNLVKASVTQKCNTNHDLTPLHCACINSNENVLKELLAVSNEINISDLDLRKPIHYAAACKGSGPLQVLINEGANLLELDNQKMTCLHMAAKTGRAHNIKIILAVKPQLLHGRDHKSMTAIAYACKYGHTEAVKTLLQYGAEVNVGCGVENMPPLSFAATYDHFELCKLLLDTNARVLSEDKYGRTPLIMAVRNGHTKIASLLLMRGSEWNHTDSQMNTPLHYAAAYGWLECIKLLLKAGADVNAENQQKITPIRIAMLKNHLGCVQKILNEPNVDVNCKDQQGRTLLLLSLVSLGEESGQVIIQLLKKGSNPNIADLEGNSALHYIAKYNAKKGLQKDPEQQNNKQEYEKNIWFQKDIIKMLLYFNGDWKKKNRAAQTPFSICLTQNNAPILKLLQNKVSLNKEPELFFVFADKILNIEFQQILLQLMENDPPTNETLNFLDKDGFTPILKYIAAFTANYPNLLNQIQFRVHSNFIQDSMEDVKNRISNADIFDQIANTIQNKTFICDLTQEHLTAAKKVAKTQIVIPFIELLKKLIYAGADCKATVQINNYSSSYDIRDGKQVERQYPRVGLRNAIHLIMTFPEKKILKFLIDQAISPNEEDQEKNTPFNLISQYERIGVKIDSSNLNGRTPFINYYSNKQFDLAYQMLDLGANVEQIDVNGMYAMKYALFRGDNNEIEKLMNRGGRINQIDNRGRNLLHHAVNMSSATVDADFQTEQFLIDKGVELNLKDDRGRTPFHYAFVKIKNWSKTDKIDPIATVKGLCNCYGIEIDVPDKWQKTPLHYASQRGSTLCASHLIANGANLEKKDVYGNSPLAVSLLNGHIDYGTFLLKYKVDLKHNWTLKEIKKRKVIEEIEEEIKVKQIENKKHRKLLDPNMNFLKQYYGEDDEEEDYNLDCQPAKVRIFNRGDLFNFGGAQSTAPCNENTVFRGSNYEKQPKDLEKKEEEEVGVSLFKAAIRNGHSGFAFRILDYGFDIMQAIQDAIEEKKFKLVHYLLLKKINKQVVLQQNNKGQNWFHIMSMNAGGCSSVYLGKIYQLLQDNGVNCKAKDIFQRTALHYAAMSQSNEVVKILMEEFDKGTYNPNEIDFEGHSALSLYLRGKSALDKFYYTEQQYLAQNNSIFNTLVEHGADVNIVYPENLYKPAFQKEEVKDENYNPQGPYKCTILINVIRLNSNFFEIMRENLKGLLRYGVRFDIVDSDGRDPMTYAIQNNNEPLVKFLLENQRSERKLDLGTKDILGKTPAHYVVNPIKFGSYENAEILNLIRRYNYPLNIKDNSHKEPIDYAQKQKSLKLYKELMGQNPSYQQIKKFSELQWCFTYRKWDQCLDYEEDLMKKEEEKVNEENVKIPVDFTGKFEVSYEVFCDHEGKPWDAYLTKVNLKNGLDGDYVFYKMQLLHEIIRQHYVVFTRKGRIGETGMNQRRSFVNLDEAKNYFKEIFMQKTGGNNFQELEKFEKKKKKYYLTKVNYVTGDIKDYLALFDYQQHPTKLKKPVFELLKEISNVTIYKRAMSQFGLASNALHFSTIKREALLQARQLLMKIKDAVDEDIEISKEGDRADFEKLTQLKENILELSCRYYEIVTLANYKNQIAPPLSNYHLIKTQYENLERLLSIESASKILRGALQTQLEINPIDYVYLALNVRIKPLENQSEFELINQYISNTRNVDYVDYNFEIGNIFRIERKGEAEMLAAFKNVPDHFLLYHGCHLYNFIGILSQGFRIAPPEAPPTGYMFGKGVYFADMFDKCAKQFNQQDSYLILLCEVVLGKSQECNQVELVERLDGMFHSIKGIGARGPDYKHTITLPNAVKIPFGKVINYFDKTPNEARDVGLLHNEFIICNTSQVMIRYLIQMNKKKTEQKHE